MLKTEFSRPLARERMDVEGDALDSEDEANCAVRLNVPGLKRIFGPSTTFKDAGSLNCGGLAGAVQVHLLFEEHGLKCAAELLEFPHLRLWKPALLIDIDGR